MSDFETNLDKLYMDLQNTIQSYDNLDESAQITHQMLNDLVKIIDTNYQLSCDTLQKLSKLLYQNSSLFQKNIIEHNKKVNYLNKEYLQAITSHKENIEKQIFEKKQTITKAKENNYLKNDDLTLDINTFLASSEQNIELLKRESMDDIAKYSYQYSEAKYSYDEDAEAYNEETFQKLDEIYIKYKKSQAKFSSQINFAIKAYNNEVEKINNQLEENREKHAIEIKEFNDEKKELSISLNNKIKEVNKEHSQFINNSKEKYVEKQKELSSERQERKSNYLKSTQETNKQYIISTAENEDKYNEDKVNYNNKTNELIEQSNYDIYLSHKKEEDKLIKLYNTSEFTKNDIKKINKEFEKYYNSRKKELEVDLDTINTEYKKKLDAFELRKAKIDSDRHTAIKKYNETELKDNKYYQEMNNNADSFSTHEITLNELETNKIINKLKFENYIKQVDIEARYDECEAKYLKINEAYLTEKKNFSLEVESSYKLKELVSNMLKQKYEKEVMYLRITGALNIEKCRKLLEYNKRQLEINTEISNESFLQQEQKIKLQNEEKKAINECKAVINNIILDLSIMNINNDIASLGNEDAYFAKKSFKKFDFMREKEINSSLEKRFEYEIKNINHYTSTFTLLLSNVENILVSSLNYIYENIVKDYITFNLIYKLFSNIALLCFNFIHEAIDSYQASLLELIDETTRFEEQFKYESSFNSSIEHYVEETERINDLIKENNYRMDFVKEEIRLENKTIQNLIYGIKNDKSISKVDANKHIITLKKDLINKNKTLKNCNELNVRYNKELKELEKKHENEKKFINNAKIANMNTLLKFKEKIVETITAIKSGLDALFQETAKNEVTFENHRDLIEEKYVLYKEYFSESMPKIYSMINQYKESILKAHKRNAYTLNLSYNQSIKDLKLENIKSRRNQVQRFTQEHLSKVRDLNIAKNKENDTLHLYQTYNKRLDNQFAIENKIKKQMLLNNTQRLYKELSAINRNINDINNDYYEYINNVTNNYKTSKDKYFHDASATKDKYEQSLKNFKMQRDLDIKNIPNVVNNKTNAYSYDIKKLNEDIDQQISEEHELYNIKKKNSKIQIDSIMQNYNKNLLEIDKEQKLYIKKVKNQKKVA